METSDIIAVVAAVLALGSVGVAGWALKYARRSATAGEKSAGAADIAAQEATRSADAAEESNRIAARALALSEPAPVAWQIEPVRGSTYQLRNKGTDTAGNVHVDESRVTCSHEGLPAGATVLPDASVQFQLWRGGDRPGEVPSELFVKWDGHSEWKAVPLQRRPPTGLAVRARR